MNDHVEAVISLCDKIETLDLNVAEQTVLRTLVDIALEGADHDDVVGYGATSPGLLGLRESIGHITLAFPDRLERRREFDRAQPPGTAYQAMPELDANGG